MHWLSMVGIVLIIAGTLFTYLGAGMNQSEKKREPASSDEEQTIRAEYRTLIEQSKLIEKENDRILAENAALSLKLRRSEQDVEIYQFRANELQDKLEEQKEEEISAITDKESYDEDQSPLQQISESPEPEPESAPADEYESEMSVIDRLQSLLATRDYAGLEQAASEQIEKNREWMTPYVYLGVASRHLGKRQKALQNFVYVVENGADDPAYDQAERALKLMTTGIQELAENNDWVALVATCNKLISEDPEWKLPYYFGGLAHTHLGDKQQAAEFLQIFISSSADDPEYARARRALKLLRTDILELQKQGDYPALIKACEREMENDPTWMTPRYLLGLSYAQLGNHDKAREHLELFIQTAADDPDYDNAQRLLDSLNQ